MSSENRVASSENRVAGSILYSRYYLLATVFLLLLTSGIFATPNYFIANPAALNLSNQPRSGIRFLTVNPYLANNFLSLKTYKTNFYTDPDWDSLQKRTMLNDIPDNGTNLNADVLVAPFEYYSRLFSITLATRILLSGTIPKSFFDLVLFGNDINRQYDLSGASINSIGYADMAFGMCYPVFKMSEPSDINNFLSLKQVNIGARLHYQKGIFVTQTDSSYGYLLTTPSAILGKVKLVQSIGSLQFDADNDLDLGATVKSFTSGPNSFALDLGATVELQKQLSAGIAILNLNSGFNWSNSPKQTVVELDIDSLSLQRLLDVDDVDSIIHIDTSLFHSIGPFKTAIPPQLLLHIAYQPIRMVTVSTYYHQYFQECKFIPDFIHALNLAVDFSPTRWFGTGISLTTDLEKDFLIGNTLHFGIGGFGLNLSVNQKNGFINSAKGFGAGINFGLNW